MLSHHLPYTCFYHNIPTSNIEPNLFRMLFLFTCVVTTTYAYWSTPVKKEHAYPYMPPLEFISSNKGKIAFFLRSYSDEFISNVVWQADGPNSSIFMSYCSKNDTVISLSNIPTSTSRKLWRFTLLDDKLVIECNNVINLIFTFLDSPWDPSDCNRRMRKSVGVVRFKQESDITALKFRKFCPEKYRLIFYHELGLTFQERFYNLSVVIKKCCGYSLT